MLILATLFQHLFFSFLFRARAAPLRRHPLHQLRVAGAQAGHGRRRRPRRPPAPLPADGRLVRQVREGPKADPLNCVEFVLRNQRLSFVYILGIL